MYICIMCVYVCVYVIVCVYVSFCVYVYVCVCMYVCIMYVYVCVCMYERMYVCTSVSLIFWHRSFTFNSNKSPT